MSYDEDISFGAYDDAVPYQATDMSAYADMEDFSAAYDEDEAHFLPATQTVLAGADGYADTHVGDAVLGDGYDDGSGFQPVEAYDTPVVSLREEVPQMSVPPASKQKLRMKKYYEAVRMLEEGGQTGVMQSLPKLKEVLAQAGEELEDLPQFFSCMQQYTAVDLFQQTSCKFSKQLRDSSLMDCSRAFPYDEFDVALRYSYSLGSSSAMRGSDEIEFSDSSSGEEEVQRPAKKPSGGQREWNSEFQALLDMPDSRAKFLGLRQLEHDFVHTAELYGKIIIGESCVPNTQKTIKPIDIGGEKFICQGILFKFAVDSFGLYRGDANAIKAAGLELSALMHYYHCNVSELHVPLMALIDYRGYRLMAVSLLPISSSSICYGTADAGATVHADPVFEKHMRHVGEILNVKPHVVGRDQVTIHGGPGDIEGHQGTDGRLYLLDFARLAPPMVPSAPGQTLYRHFRMEFVRSYCKPLSSDAFSRMAPDPERVNALEVKEAQEYFKTTTIPGLATSLDEMSRETVPTAEDLIHIFHKAGVNLRFFGHVRQLLTSEPMKSLLLQEAVARTVKSQMNELFRKKMAQIGVPSDEPFRRVVLDLMSLLLGQRGNYSVQYWDMHVPKLALEKYPELLTIEEQKAGGLLALVSRMKVARRVLQLTGVKVASDAQHVLDGTMCPDLAEVIAPDEFELLDQDLLQLDCHVKHMNIIEYADGMSLFYDAVGKDLSSPSKRRLLVLSKKILLKSLKASSMNFMAKYQLGNVFRVMGSKLIAPEATVRAPTPCTEAATATMLEAITTFKALLSERIDTSLRYRTCVSLAKVLWARGRLIPDFEEFKIMVEESVDYLQQAGEIQGDLKPAYLAAKVLAQAAPLAVRHHKQSAFGAELFDRACDKLQRVLDRDDVEGKRPTVALLLASAQLLRWLLTAPATPGNDPSKQIAGFLGQANRSGLDTLFREVQLTEPEEFWKLFSVTMQADPPSGSDDDSKTPGGSVFEAFVEFCDASGLTAVVVTEAASSVSTNPAFGAALRRLLLGCPTATCVTMTGMPAAVAMSAVPSVSTITSLTLGSLSPPLSTLDALNLLSSLPGLEELSVDALAGDLPPTSGKAAATHSLTSLSLGSTAASLLWSLPLEIKDQLLSLSTAGFLPDDAEKLLADVSGSCPAATKLALRDSTADVNLFEGLKNSAVTSLDATGTVTMTLAAAAQACTHLPGIRSVTLHDGATVFFGAAENTARIVMTKPMVGGMQHAKSVIEVEGETQGNVSVVAWQQVGSGSHVTVAAGTANVLRVKHMNMMNGLKSTFAITCGGEDLGQLSLSKQVLGHVTTMKGSAVVAGLQISVSWQEKVQFNRKSVAFSMSLPSGGVTWKLEERGHTLQAVGNTTGSCSLPLSLIAMLAVAITQVLTAKR